MLNNTLSNTIQIDVSGFEPHSIAVDVLEPSGNLTIRALRYILSIDQNNYIRKELLRTFHIPVETDINLISSTLSSNGILTIYLPSKTHHYYNRNNQCRALTQTPMLSYNTNSKQRLHKSIKNDENSIEEDQAIDGGVINQNKGDLFELVEPSTPTQWTSPILLSSKKPTTSANLQNVQTKTACSSSPVSPSLSLLQLVSKHKTENTVYSIEDFLRSSLKPKYCKKRNCLIVKLKMSGHDPQGITIKVLSNTLQIVSKKNSKDVSTAGLWIKEIPLVDQIKTKEIRSYFTSNSCLVIELPL
ncbi:hypothetical protein GJ496_009135 [Pomphorhynchus laevis]|nr:hypothetical protein GJ496_009135 [Pomphorhynchus laevis]